MKGATYHLSKIKKVFILAHPFNQHSYNIYKLKHISSYPNFLLTNKYINNSLLTKISMPLKQGFVIMT